MHQNRDIRSESGLFGTLASGSSADSGSITSQNDPTSNEIFSEEDDDEIVDLETIPTD